MISRRPGSRATVQMVSLATPAKQVRTVVVKMCIFNYLTNRINAFIRVLELVSDYIRTVFLFLTHISEKETTRFMICCILIICSSGSRI